MKKQKKTTKRTTKGLLAYHIAASLVSTAPHPHTGRPVHHRHTSHGVLILALILTGMVLFSNLGVLRAYGLASSGNQTITATINGAAPTVGADITFPTTQTKTKSPQVLVAGTCMPSLLVATYNNGSFAGSTVCSGTSDYTITVQLTVGTNVLQSQNYDGLNQPGPVTPQVLITLEEDPVPVTPTAPSGPSNPDVPLVATTPADIQPDPFPPSIVTPIAAPSENPCYDPIKSDAVSQKVPKIIANCISRSISSGDTVTLPVRVSGDHPPFALQIDWGDGISELKSVLDTRFNDYEHLYVNTGIIDVKLKTTDSKGASSFLQTVVQVNSEPSGSAAPGAAGSFGNITAGLNAIWSEAPVPLYWAAVTLVLGFWVGDIFQRVLAKGKYALKQGKGSRTFNRRRHA